MTTAKAPPPATRRVIASGMMVVMGAAVLARLTELPVLSAAGWLAMGITILASLRTVGYREYYLLGLCGAAALAVVVLHSDPWHHLAAALDQSNFLMAFILLLGLLYEAAATSPSIMAVGPYITQQPPSRRFFALYAGTGTLAVLFNAGIVTFLVPLIQNGIRSSSSDATINSVREQRQLSALLRGFAWCVVWSPTALAPLMIVELIPGVSRPAWMLYGIVIFGLVMLAGALEDVTRFRDFPAAARSQRPPFPSLSLARLVMACVWLFAITITAMWLTGDNFVFGLMIACPLMLVGWLTSQGVGRPPIWMHTGARLYQVFDSGLPKAAPIAITLAAAGFMGRAAAALIPPQTLSIATAHLAVVPDFVILSAIPPIIALISLLGLSPIMMAVFLGSLFGGKAELPVDPTLLALAISCGWALSMTFSPLSTLALVTSRISGVGPLTLTWRWNLSFSLLAAALLIPVFALLSRLTGSLP